MRPARSALVALSFLAACSSARIHEVYHFPGTRNGEVVNYYRVEVKGRVHGTQLRYLSGFFDNNALDRYFNSFSQPDDGIFVPAASAASGSQPKSNAVLLENKAETTLPRPQADETRDADPSGKGRKLVLLLSQSTEAIAEAIGELAQTEAFAGVVGRLVFRDQIAAAQSQRRSADRLERDLAAARTEAVELASRLEDDENTEAELLQFANQLSAALGAKEPFESAKEAVRWLKENSAELTGAER